MTEFSLDLDIYFQNFDGNFKSNLNKTLPYGQASGETAGGTWKTVVTPFEFFRLVRVRRMHHESAGKRLYLRRVTATMSDHNRLILMLQKTKVIRPAGYYGGAGVMRVLVISDLPTEDIICPVGSTRYAAHLAAMQCWGLTDRRPKALMMTRARRQLTPMLPCAVERRDLLWLWVSAWSRLMRVVVYRKRVRHCTAKNYQLDLFDPDDGYYEYPAIVTNREVTGGTLWFFMCGRGTQEKVYSEIKGSFAFDCMPTQHYGEGSA